jgi:hypothetical protein
MGTETRLKYREIPAVRDYLLEQQNHCCGLCGDHIEEGKAVLDHDHRSGIIRRVLHRGCNSMLGKIENNMARSEIDIFRLMKIADKVADYIQNNTTDWIHPTYKTKEERAMKAYKKKKGGGGKKKGY